MKSVSTAAAILLLASCSSREESLVSSDSTLIAMPRPSWATPDHLSGRVDSSERIEVQVHLRMRNEAQVAALVKAVSDPRSPQYHHFLSRPQYNALFAPLESEVQSVRAHLEKSGLT